MAQAFGKGAKDVKMWTWQRLGIFTHTLYWSRPSDDAVAKHIEELRSALKIAG